MHWWDVVSVTGNLLLAQATGGDTSPVQPDFFTAFVRMAAVLACIVGLLLAIAAALKKFNMLNRSLFGSQRTIRVLETAYLGPKQSLALVQAGRDVLLLGMTQQSITFLSKIDLHGKDKAGEVHAPEQDFAAVLESALVHGSHNGQAVEDSSQGQKRFFRRLIARLTTHRLSV